MNLIRSGEDLRKPERTRGSLLRKHITECYRQSRSGFSGESEGSAPLARFGE